MAFSGFSALLSVHSHLNHLSPRLSVHECRALADCLTHWGRVTHICISELTIIGSDNGLLPSRRQAIIWNNDGLLFIGPLGTNFSEIVIEILTSSFKKMRLKVSSAKRRPFCLGLDVLTTGSMEWCIAYWSQDRMGNISQITYELIFPEWKGLYFDAVFAKNCSWWSCWWRISVVSDNGLVMNRQQAIIWTSDGLAYWSIYSFFPKYSQ